MGQFLLKLRGNIGCNSTLSQWGVSRNFTWLSMKQNLVLIQPRIGEWDIFTKSPTPPLSLLCAASLVCRDMEVRLVDLRTGRDWKRRLAAAIDEKTVAVGVTSLTGRMLLSALEAVREARRLTAAPIIWGGVHASLMPEQTVSHELADYIVEGEGETALAELARRLAAGADTGGIPGVWRKVNGHAQGTPRAPLLDVNTLPPAAYHIVDTEKYIQLYNGRRTLFYQTSRGCPCTCAHCYNKTYNSGRWRALSAEKTLKEAAEFKERYRLGAIYFWDDNFFIDPVRARRIISGMKELGLRCLLHGADVDTLAAMSDKDLDFLEEAGVDTLAIGVESAVDRVRSEVLKKRGDIALVRAQLLRFKGRKMEIGCFFMLGLPGETAGEIKQTVAFAMEILRWGPNFRVPQFFNFTPYPGTQLFRQLEGGGTDFPQSIEGWGNYDWNHSMMYNASPEIQDLLSRIVLISKYLDKNKASFLDCYWFGKLVMNQYRPVAWFRLRTGFLRPMPEFWMSAVMNKLGRILE